MINNVNINDLEAIRDSISKIIVNIEKMANFTNPEPYTIENLQISQWSLMVAISAAILGVIGAIFAYLSYKYSRMTAINVARMSTQTQLILCDQFIEELYRSEIYTLALLQKIDIDSNYNISESFIIALKLPMFDDIFNLTTYNTHSQGYSVLIDLRTRIKNYDEQVNVVQKRVALHETLNRRDKTGLVYKPIQIMKKVGLFCNIMHIVDSYALHLMQQIVALHISHMLKNSDIESWIDSYVFIDFASDTGQYNSLGALLDNISSKVVEAEPLNINDIISKNSYLTDQKRDKLKHLEGKISNYDSLANYSNLLFKDCNQLLGQKDIATLLNTIFCIDACIEWQNISKFE